MFLFYQIHNIQTLVPIWHRVKYYHNSAHTAKTGMNIADAKTNLWLPAKISNRSAYFDVFRNVIYIWLLLRYLNSTLLSCVIRHCRHTACNTERSTVKAKLMVDHKKAVLDRSSH